MSHTPETSLVFFLEAHLFRSSPSAGKPRSLVPPEGFRISRLAPPCARGAPFVPPPSSEANHQLLWPPFPRAFTNIIDVILPLFLRNHCKPRWMADLPSHLSPPFARLCSGFSACGTPPFSLFDSFARRIVEFLHRRRSISYLSRGLRILFFTIIFPRWAERCSCFPGPEFLPVARATPLAAVSDSDLPVQFASPFDDGDTAFSRSLSAEFFLLPLHSSHRQPPGVPLPILERLHLRRCRGFLLSSYPSYLPAHCPLSLPRRSILRWPFTAAIRVPPSRFEGPLAVSFPPPLSFC